MKILHQEEGGKRHKHTPTEMEESKFTTNTKKEKTKKIKEMKNQKVNRKISNFHMGIQ